MNEKEGTAAGDDSKEQSHATKPQVPAGGPDIAPDVLRDEMLSEEPGYFVPRSLQLRDQVRHEVLAHPSAILAVSGAGHVELQDLAPRSAVVHTMDTWSQSEKGGAIVAISAEDDFRKLSESNDNVHWLEYEECVLKWKKTRGDIALIQRHRGNAVSLFGNVGSVLNPPHRVVLVSGEPGAGKSSLLAHLAMKEVVFVVNLGPCANKLPENEVQSVVEFLLETWKAAEDVKERARRQLEHMEDMCLLFDGYDELDPASADKAVSMFQFLLTSKLRKLWIAIRPEQQQRLEEELSSLAFTLKPFSELDQRDFLVKYWKKGLSEGQGSMLNDFVDAVLLLVRKCLVSDSAFSGAPAQLSVLASALENSFKKFCETSEVSLPQSFDCLRMYDEFVNVKLNLFCDRNKCDLDGFKDEFYHNYTTLALLTFLSPAEVKKWTGSDAKLEKVSQFAKKVEHDSRPLAVIRDVTGASPVFLDSAIVDYFTALWLSKNYKRVSEYVKEHYFEPKFEVTRNFLDRKLCQKWDLHCAVLRQDRGRVQQLLSCQDLNTRDDGGRTALHLAVLNYVAVEERPAREDILRALLDHGADPGVEDRVLRYKPLRMADSIRASPVVLGLLLQRHTDFSDLVRTKHSIGVEERLQEILRLVARHGFVQLLMFLLKCGTRVGHDVTLRYQGCKTKATLLHEAARCGQLRLVRFLVEHKASLEARDSRRDRTPLMWAAEAGQLLVVSLLVLKGASVAARDDDGSTALLRAAESGRLDVVKLLAQHLSEVTTRDKYGDNLLHSAVRSGNLHLVAFALRSGVGVDCRNHVQETPLWWAAQSGQLLVTEMLLQRGANIHSRDAVCGYTPLHIAAREGHLPVVQCLVLYGANLSSRDEFGRTPSEVAVWYKNLTVAELLRYAEKKRTRASRVMNYSP